eukprot:10822774-Prorocentrum_lima.AAC.1
MPLHHQPHFSNRPHQLAAQFYYKQFTVTKNRPHRLNRPRKHQQHTRHHRPLNSLLKPIRIAPIQ